MQASVDAARDAAAVSGPSEALQHVERVLELWPQVDDPEALVGLELSALLVWAAEIAFFAGAPGQAAELIRRAISSADPADEVQVGLLHERLGWFLLPGGVDREAGLAAFERAVELVPAEPPSAERVRVLAALGSALNSFWRHDESRAACEQALAVADAIGDDRPALLALTDLGVDLYLLGQSAEGIDCLHDARRRARERGTAPDELRTYISLSDLLLYAGRLPEAARDALEGLAAARRRGYERSGGTLLAANAAEALLGLGDWARAEEVLDAALHAAGSFRPEALHILRAELALGRGELEDADRHLEAGSRAALEPQSTAAYACLQAELALWEGRPAEAASALDGVLRSDAPAAVQIRAARVCALALRAEAELAQLAAVQRQEAGVEEARHRAVRLIVRARRSAAAAAAVMPDAEGWLAIAEAEHTRVEGRSSPERWQSAIAVWDELGRPYLAAYCRWRYAEALLSAGSSRMEAAIPAREAHQVASDLGARSAAGRARAARSEGPPRSRGSRRGRAARRGKRPRLNPARTRGAPARSRAVTRTARSPQSSSSASRQRASTSRTSSASSTSRVVSTRRGSRNGSRRPRPKSDRPVRSWSVRNCRSKLTLRHRVSSFAQLSPSREPGGNRVVTRPAEMHRDEGVGRGRDFR